MTSLRSELERVCHVSLLAGLIGAFAGLGEYAYLFLNSAFPDNPFQAYWNIVLPYTIVGLVGGVLVAAGLRLALYAGSYGRRVTRVSALLIALTAFAYLIVGTTYQLGPPLLKLSNLLAYLGSAVVAVGIGILLHRARRPMRFRVERKSRPALLRVGMPLAVSVLGPAALLLPTVYLRSGQAVEAVPTTSTRATLGTRPNIIIILIDALRADHLPMYGYSRQTAPHLAALARQGMLFTRAYASAPWTKPSVATMFSSLYSPAHKVTADSDFLSGSVIVLPELLDAIGYKTIGISASAYVSPTFGYSQGFDEFRLLITKSQFRLTLMGRLAEDVLGSATVAYLLRERRDIVPRADAITELTLKYVAQSSNGPLFLYVHYVDPHDPYKPPPPYNGAFDHRGDPPLRAGRVDPLKRLPPGQDPERIGKILDRYDGEILYADHEVGRLLEGLKALRVLDNALVIVTADHGEEFFEHGKPLHGNSLYEELLRVPLLMSWPGRILTGATYEGLVGHIDLMPTILALLGIEPPTQIQGISFAAQLADPNHPMPKRKLFAHMSNYQVSLEMVRDERYKLIQHIDGPQQGLKEFYDLETDPLETRSIASQAPAQMAAFSEELDAFNHLMRQAGSVIRAEKVKKLDSDTERALRSLGYIK